MSMFERQAIVGLVVAVCVASAQASMAVTQGQPATAWPAGVTFDTVNGGLTYTSGYAAASNQRLSQTFTAPSSGPLVLDKISIGYEAQFGDNGYQLFLYEVSDATASSYTVGTNLFGTLMFDTPGGATGEYIMTFDFDGPDELTLTPGQAYALEILGPQTYQRLQWRQPGSNPGDLYLAGSPYVNRSQVFSGAQDFTMGVHLTPEPATFGVLLLGGLAIIRRRRAA